jgi:hypothetical protein
VVTLVAQGQASRLLAMVAVVAMAQGGTGKPLIRRALMHGHQRSTRDVVWRSGVVLIDLDLTCFEGGFS